MFELLHQVTIEAPVQKVFDALTTQKGLKGWWTADVEAEPRRGSTAIFGFGGRGTVFHMLIDELAPPKRLKWLCSSDNEEWEGTELLFDLVGKEKNETVVNFTHSGWRSAEVALRLCNTHWGHLMIRLKSYVEGESPGPFFPE